MVKRTVRNAAGVISKRNFNAATFKANYRPVSGFDRGGGAKKITATRGKYKGQRVRLWERKPKGKVVRYTRTFLFEEPVGKGGDLTPTTKADVIIEDVEPVGFSESDQARKLKSRELRNRMEKILMESPEFKGKFGGELPRFKTWGGTEIRDKRTVTRGFVDDFRAWTRGGK